jgi:hypothetical protein
MHESIVMMPNSYFVNDYRHLYPRPLAEARDEDGQVGCGTGARCFTGADGEAHRGAVLANFGQMYKIQPGLFVRWCRALRASTNASLWLLKFPKQAAPMVAANFAKRLPAHQLVLSDLLPMDRHLSVKSLATLALDTLHFNGHTTAADTLWAGVPMLSLPGDRMPVCECSSRADGFLCFAGSCDNDTSVVSISRLTPTYLRMMQACDRVIIVHHY